jgi:hypothetical protein
MPKQYLTIPISVALTNERNWSALDDKKTCFFVMRFHFMLEDRQVKEPHRVGEKLAVFGAPKGGTVETVLSAEFEREDVHAISSVRTSLQESKVFASIAQKVGGEVGVKDLAKLSSGMESQVTAELKLAFSESHTVEESSKRRVKVSFGIKNTLPSDGRPVVAVPVFQRSAFDIYLAYVDWLVVEYQKKFYGLRKRRKNLPEIVGGIHKNKWTAGIPLATAYYWKHLKDSSMMMFEDDYSIEVADPDEITIAPSQRTKRRAVSFPKVPTLYQIARATFPVKWIKRKGEWTEDDLMQLELDDVSGGPFWKEWKERLGI